MKNKIKQMLGGAGLGSAFLMANSSIGPGFLTQTSFFTEKLIFSFGFVILISVLLDLGAQLNTWRVITISELRLQDLANALLPKLGYFITALVVFGGFAFNIGNIAGAALGLNVLTNCSFEFGAILSSLIVLFLFWISHIGKMLDTTTKLLGILKISLAIFVMYKAKPLYSQAFIETIVPEKTSLPAIVTIVGGTVGGYITFSGAHRLLDANIKGVSSIAVVNKSAIQGIFISTLMRYILFLAVVGVVANGVVLDAQNPAATVFQHVAGNIGLSLFGIILWSAAVSSILGASYTSISFIKTFHPFIARNEKFFITIFIIVSCLIFVLIGKPKLLLLFAGLINGFILPIALSIILLAIHKKSIMKGYQHPIWMQVLGWLVVLIMGAMSVMAIIE